MVTVDKCCICLRLSTGAIILGSFGAFTSLLLVMVIGGFVLSYDNFVAQSYEKEGSDNDDNRRLADFLSTYKNGENGRQLKFVYDTIFVNSRANHIGHLCRPSMYQLREFTFFSVRNYQCKT